VAAEGGTLTLRASGTEPKLKYYLEAVNSNANKAMATADELVNAVDTELVQSQRSGLQQPAMGS